MVILPLVQGAKLIIIDGDWFEMSLRGYLGG